MLYLSVSQCDVPGSFQSTHRCGGATGCITPLVTWLVLTQFQLFTCYRNSITRPVFLAWKVQGFDVQQQIVCSNIILGYLDSNQSIGESKSPTLPLGYIPNDVANESRAVSRHLPQTHPHPDYIATTFLPAIGMLRRCQVHLGFNVFSLTAFYFRFLLGGE